jgi:hypothetical protein
MKRVNCCRRPWVRDPTSDTAGYNTALQKYCT